MKVQSFIFIHDQDVLVEYIKVNKFKELPNLKYVFVGNKPINKINNLENVIIARNLPINIEQYPLFTSFTGWYALWKNNLIDADYINLFEYDVILSGNFIQTQQERFGKYDFIGYIPHPMTGFHYVKNINWVEHIIPSIQKHYGIDMYSIVGNKLKENPQSYWSSTSNSTFSKQTFLEYMEWFEKLIDDIKESRTCGHAHERSLSFFYLVKNKKVSILPGIMQHFQLNSHGTQGYSVNFKESIKNLVTNI